MATQQEMKEAKDKFITLVVAECIGWGFSFRYANDRAHRMADKMSHEEIMNCLTKGEQA